MNPIVKIINKILITINKLLDSLDHQTTDIIKRVFFLLVFIIAAISGFAGFQRGKESARIKRPPLAEYTNDVFNVSVLRNKRGGVFDEVIDSELFKEIKQYKTSKIGMVIKNEKLRQAPGRGIIAPSGDIKMKQVPSVIFEDKLIDEIKPGKTKKKDIRPLKKSRLLNDTVNYYGSVTGVSKQPGPYTTPQKDIIDNSQRKKTKKKYTDNLPLNIVKYIDQKNFFLTFDVGSDNEHITYILNTLRAHKIKATFFITGTFMKKFPADVRRIVKEGHIVGNHTLTHSLSYTRKKLLYELKATEKLYRKITGKHMLKIWRAPYLQHISNKRILRTARSIGYQHIDASLVVMDDWIKNPNSVLSNRNFLRLFKNRLSFKHNKRLFIDRKNHRLFKPKKTSYRGVIMLMHTGRYRKGKKDFVYCLHDVIVHLKEHGYYFDNCGRFARRNL